MRDSAAAPAALPMIVDGRRDRLHQENLLAGHRFQQLHRHLTVWEAVNAAIAEVRSQLAHHRCGQAVFAPPANTENPHPSPTTSASAARISQADATRANPCGRSSFLQAAPV